MKLVLPFGGRNNRFKKKIGMRDLFYLKNLLPHTESLK